jgi:hypothetical protein
MTSISSIPKTEHWAILSETSHYIPADQRSIDHPGHGYPAETVTSISYQVFDSEEKLLAELTSLHRYTSRRNYRAIHVNPLEVVTDVSIKLK